MLRGVMATILSRVVQPSAPRSQTLGKVPRSHHRGQENEEIGFRGRGAAAEASVMRVATEQMPYVLIT
jgi:hypothetical protein